MVGCDNTGKALGHSGVSPIGGFKNRSDKIPLRNAVARVAPASGRGKDDMTSQGPIQVPRLGLGTRALTPVKTFLLWEGVCVTTTCASVKKYY